MSATMPDFNKWLSEFDCNGVNTLELIKDKMEYTKFKRSKIENIGSISMESLAEKLEGKSLVVVNKKKTAKALYDIISTKKFHLSTYMTPRHRKKVIKEIQEALKLDKEFCLVSTSLIEAGIDFDFDYVYREEAGLDNLLQTAGRCNREGEKDNAMTYSFKFDEEEYHIKNSEMKIMQYFTKESFERFEDIDSLEAISFYYNRLYDYTKNKLKSNSFDGYIKSKGYDFKSYAENFKLIDENNYSVVIRLEEYIEQVDELIESLLFKPREAKRGLQEFTVALKMYEYEVLKKEGVIIEKNGVDILSNKNYYDDSIGVSFEDKQNLYYY